MQVDVQRYLDFLEDSGKFYFVDTESQGLEGDYGRLYVGSVKEFDGPTTTFYIGENFSDRGMVRDLKDKMEEADAWVTFYGKGHDIPLINTRLARWGYKPLEQRHHIDMFYQLVRKLKTARKSQAHLLEFLEDTMEILGLKVERKMTISPNVWSDLPTHYHRNIKILRDRCDSDVDGLKVLYQVTRGLIRDIKR